MCECVYLYVLQQLSLTEIRYQSIVVVSLVQILEGKDTLVSQSPQVFEKILGLFTEYDENNRKYRLTTQIIITSLTCCRHVGDNNFLEDVKSLSEFLLDWMTQALNHEQFEDGLFGVWLFLKIRQ